MLADAGGIGYGEYLQVFTKKTNTFQVTNYVVQLTQKRSDLVFCLFASKRILLDGAILCLWFDSEAKFYSHDNKIEACFTQTIK